MPDEAISDDGTAPGDFETVVLWVLTLHARQVVKGLECVIDGPVDGHGFDGVPGIGPRFGLPGRKKRSLKAKFIEQCGAVGQCGGAGCVFVQELLSFAQPRQD